MNQTSALSRRAMRPASSAPATQQPAVTAQVHCQPPTRLASQATTGGPASWPRADHCCIQPTVVAMERSPGASVGASANSVPGISPPTLENSSAPA